MSLTHFNKKGQSGLIIFVGILFLLLFLGMGIAFLGVTLDWTFDTIVPEFLGIGSIGSTNITQISQFTLVPVNNVIQSFTWLSGVLYILALLGLFGLSFAFRITGNKWLMAFFISCMFMLVIGSIFISNIYEDFYDDAGEVGDRLHEYTLLSFLLLYSPMIMCILGFVCGVIMFTGGNRENEL